MEQFIVQIKPLTPLWTGDVNKECCTLRETGIIGSLRWWYEALIRGLGGSACDPTNSKCDEKYHCDACELFGCTGWARKFKLEVKIDDGAKSICEAKIGTRDKRKLKSGYKYLVRKTKGIIFNSAPLKFLPLREISEGEWNLLNKTLYIISNYGALGASTSQGNGVISITNNSLPHSQSLIPIDKSQKVQELPKLDNFFFYKFNIKFNNNILELINSKVFWTHSKDHSEYKEDWRSWTDVWDKYNFLPIAFHIRDSIRHLENDRDKRHKIFGEAGKGSTVFVSHGYRVDDKTVEVRIYGYSKDNVKDKIKCELKTKIKDKLFSSNSYNNSLSNCTLKYSKNGKDLLEELI
ncbi:CRISPR-associated protein, Cmr1 family [Acetomicrobium thermoterrenum DSM 13490]|uniref:CRISPR-associated protein, Cmr1 family n=1 Tax=Acetomicrobium thermoterrenum DSM 13490 TaxID=1120987 RepID=A0A1H3F3C8_9BACT|nr:type III-B CRISPR module RAMP protein Cmr1 [Acetomicrobium thermoterrenum]SDX84694.1 CRISPR-associated protein, Cmr1 family [Acetomicrobium thermoterrenum DSM 13490]